MTKVVQTLNIMGDVCRVDYNGLANTPDLYQKQDIDEIIDGVNANIDAVKQSIKDGSILRLSKTENPYLYEAFCMNYPIEKAIAYFESGNADSQAGGCSAFFDGYHFVRNLDWTYDNGVEFMVKTPRFNGTYGVMGMVGAAKSLDRNAVESAYEGGLHPESLDILPWLIVDGRNDGGLMACVNVVPADKDNAFPSVPTGTKEVTLYSSMVVRYVLDHFTSAEEAANYLKEHVEIKLNPTIADMGYNAHWMIADIDSCYVVEVIEDGEVNIIEQDKMTNFHITDTPAEEGSTVYTNNDVPDGHNPSDTGITNYGAGLERWNWLVNNTEPDMSNPMGVAEALKYTQAYSRDMSDPSTFWFSEFVGGDYTVDTSSQDSSFQAHIAAIQAAYANRSREEDASTYGTWQTTHSVVYGNDKARVCVQEDYTKVFEYKFDYASETDLGYIKRDIEDLWFDKQEKLTAGEGISIDPDTNVISADGGIPDAPEDGNIYGRKDGEWTQVQGGGGTAKEKAPWIKGQWNGIRIISRNDPAISCNINDYSEYCEDIGANPYIAIISNGAAFAMDMSESTEQMYANAYSWEKNDMIRMEEGGAVLGVHAGPALTDSIVKSVLVHDFNGYANSKAIRWFGDIYTMPEHWPAIMYATDKGGYVPSYAELNIVESVKDQINDFIDWYNGYFEDSKPRFQANGAYWTASIQAWADISYIMYQWQGANAGRAGASSQDRRLVRTFYRLEDIFSNLYDCEETTKDGNGNRTNASVKRVDQMIAANDVKAARTYVTNDSLDSILASKGLVSRIDTIDYIGCPPERFVDRGYDMTKWAWATCMWITDGLSPGSVVEAENGVYTFGTDCNIAPFEDHVSWDRLGVMVKTDSVGFIIVDEQSMSLVPAHMTAEDCYVESLEDAAADMNGLKNTRYVDRWMKKYGQWTPNSLCTMSRIWGALSTDDWNQPRLGARAYIPAAGEMIAIAPYWGQIKQAFYDCFGRTPADGQYWTSTHRPYNGGTAAYGNFVESGGEWSFELIDNTQYNTDNKHGLLVVKLPYFTPAE